MILLCTGHKATWQAQYLNTQRGLSDPQKGTFSKWSWSKLLCTFFKWPWSTLLCIFFKWSWSKLLWTAHKAIWQARHLHWPQVVLAPLTQCTSNLKSLTPKTLHWPQIVFAPLMYIKPIKFSTQNSALASDRICTLNSMPKHCIGIKLYIHPWFNAPQT